MNLTQIKGNTWVIEANQLIPLYKLGDGRCVLLDTGLFEEREELEETLLSNGLTPAGCCAPTPMWTTAPTAGIFRKNTAQRWPSPFPRRVCAPPC